jgi:hypothetical protein
MSIQSFLDNFIDAEKLRILHTQEAIWHLCVCGIGLCDAFLVIPGLQRFYSKSHFLLLAFKPTAFMKESQKLIKWFRALQALTNIALAS